MTKPAISGARLYELWEQLRDEYVRTDPVLREAVTATGSGGMGTSTPPSQWPAVIAALRTLPDDAGRAEIDRVLAPVLGDGSVSDPDQGV
jgi:hypothetical protein